MFSYVRVRYREDSDYDLVIRRLEPISLRLVPQAVSRPFCCVRCSLLCFNPTRCRKRKCGPVAGKRLFLRFEGVTGTSKAWVNGVGLPVHTSSGMAPSAAWTGSMNEPRQDSQTRRAIEKAEMHGRVATAQDADLWTFPGLDWCGLVSRSNVTTSAP